MSSKKRSLKKRFLNSPLVLWPAVILASALLRLIFLTNRKTYDWPAQIAPYAHGEQPAIFCFWHGRMIAQLFLIPPKRRTFVLSTPHRDGLIASMLTRSFGIRTVYGTRSKGAAAAATAARGLLAVLQQGHNVSLTPDGPRGPTQQAAPGAAYLASKSGHPLIPVTFSATRYKRLRSWDRFLMFLPFGRIHYIGGEPIHVPANADDDAIAAATQRMQHELNRITDVADAVCRVVA